MISLRRQRQILEYISARDSAQVAELGSAFGISLSTVRRDLREMEQSGLVRRVHGGVVLAEERDESPRLQRAAHNPDEKQRIARAAAELVCDGSTIIISAGTTTGAMVPLLRPRRGLTVITNALHVAYQLTSLPHIDVIVLGGWLRHSESSLLGHLTAQALQELRADQIFIGAFGVDPEHGLTGANMQEVETDRRLLAAAREVIALADHSKLGRAGSVRLLPLEQVGRLITGAEAPEPAVHALRARGVAVQQV